MVKGRERIGEKRREKQNSKRKFGKGPKEKKKKRKGFVFSLQKVVCFGTV